MDSSSYYAEFWPRYADPPPDQSWLPITYWHYWDFARTFFVSLAGRIFVFDTPFLDEQDDYANYFVIWDLGVLPPGADAREVWLAAPPAETKTQKIPVSSVTLDLTRKSFLDPKIFEAISRD